MQASKFLRRGVNFYSHWCPGCGEVHAIFDNWFDGNVDCPTFQPSVKITGKQTVVDEFGEWTGEWVKGPDGHALDYCCHYFLDAGMLKFQNDCTHALKGQTVPLPALPPFLTDAWSPPP